MSTPKPILYVDNAATSFPKPREVLQEMVEQYGSIGVSPGRGSYDLSREAEALALRIRGQICRFFGGEDPARVVFGYNATDALNTLILGLAEPGGHVVSSMLEHNSVLRPLHHLQEEGRVHISLVPFDRAGFIDPADVKKAIQSNTRFVILTHASNVTGTIQPMEEIGTICQQQGVPLVLDVTQSAGLVSIDMKGWGASAVAFTGHKSLLGPTGIGGLVIGRDLEIRTSRFGGTGVESSKLIHTQSYPHRLEAGTINLMGIIGLSAGLRYIEEKGMDRLYQKEMNLCRRLREGLSAVEGLKLYCAESLDRHLPLLLCDTETMGAEEVSSILDGDFRIATRAGLHCAPLAHEGLGTQLRGAVRISLGPSNTEGEMDQICAAMGQIAQLGKTRSKSG